MNCDECRESVVGDGRPTGEAVQHAAACPACAAWIARESAVMGVLERAGAAWREAPMAGRIADRLRGRPGRRAVPRMARWVAAAAVLVLAAGGIAVALKPSPANAMTAMLRRVRELGTLRFTLETPSRGSGVFFIHGPDLRLESSEGYVHIIHAGESVVLRPDRREIIRGGRADGMLDLYGVFLALGEAPRIEELGLEPLDGRPAEVFRVAVPAPFDGSGQAATVWLDVETRLPRRVEIPAPAEGVIVFRDFAFDGAMDGALFDLSPAGFTERPPEATTPAIGNVMASKLRNLGMAFQVYLQEHDNAAPDSLEQLAPYLEEGGLRSLRRPQESMGYVYVRPGEPMRGDRILIYERFAEQSEQVWVLMADTSVRLKTQAELAALLRAAGER